MDLLRCVATIPTRSSEKPDGTATPARCETFSHEVAPAGSTAKRILYVLSPKEKEDLRTTPFVARWSYQDHGEIGQKHYSQQDWS